MAKRTAPESSPFNALLDARRRPAEHSEVQTSEHSDIQVAEKPLAKSVDQEYVKFTSYIRKRTHRAVKVKLVGQDREMSDLVEQLLSDWLIKESR